MQLDTWTITITMQVFAGDMPKEHVIANAEQLLGNLLDGTDFTDINIVNAERDTY